MRRQAEVHSFDELHEDPYATSDSDSEYSGGEMRRSREIDDADAEVDLDGDAELELSFAGPRRAYEADEDYATELEEPHPATVLGEFESGDFESARLDPEDRADRDDELPLGGDFDVRDDHARRLFELSFRGFESERELELEVDSVLREIERDYFFGPLKKRMKQLARVGFDVASQAIPAVGVARGLAKVAGQALRGGGLMPLAKSALGALAASTPLGAAALPALKALGFSSKLLPQQSGPAWSNFAKLAKGAYGQLAADVARASARELEDPALPSRLATRALDAALRARGGGIGGGLGGGVGGGRIRRVRLRRGERLVIDVE
jgi:hypothetical protein